jgi:hypothetical protein
LVPVDVSPAPACVRVEFCSCRCIARAPLPRPRMTRCLYHRIRLSHVVSRDLAAAADFGLLHQTTTNWRCFCLDLFYRFSMITSTFHPPCAPTENPSRRLVGPNFILHSHLRTSGDRWCVDLFRFGVRFAVTRWMCLERAEASSRRSFSWS